MERMRPPVNQRGGMYALSEEMEMKARISTLSRKVEELEGKQLHEVHTVSYDSFSEGFDVRMCKHCRTIQATTIQCSIW